MYLSTIRLWNFRKFGGSEFNLEKPHVELQLTKGLNVLIGENDSGKTAIIDAIKMVLKTHSFEWLRVEPEDFYNDSNRFRIELVFRGLADLEAKNFTEWLGWEGEGEKAVPLLRLIYGVKRNLKTGQLAPTDIRAGVDDEGRILTAEAKEYLKVTYLKPLRDAASELVPKRNSRLSQILSGHEAFKDKHDSHSLVDLFADFNKAITNYFHGKDNSGNPHADQKGKGLKNAIDTYIQSFYDKTKESKFDVTDGKLRQILERLALSIKDEINPGLGTLNRLFMASELLHLDKNGHGLQLGLIEEMEAHLHPQAQMQIVEALQRKDTIQLILTTHSPNIGSKVNLNRLIFCHKDKVYPLGPEYTQLDSKDYAFLEVFLDATKANLFFAKGVILVEGWAEEILLPLLAKKIGIDLTERGVSIVNVGSTAFLRYSKIYQRKNAAETLELPVAIITDSDVNPDKAAELVADGPTRIQQVIKDKVKKYDGGSVKTFISPHKTLEYCLYKSTHVGPLLQNAVEKVHPQIDTVDFENALLSKMKKRSLKKTQIARRLATALYEDLKKPHGEQTITIDPTDSDILYLIQAIKYASGV